MAIVIQTLIRYLILALTLIAGLFLVLSIARQDWMREEITIQYSYFENYFQAIKNLTATFVPSYAKTVGNFIDSIPNGASASIMAHFGLKQTCLMTKWDGFRNPVQLALPKIQWCFKNDLFTNPKKYNLGDNVSMEMIEDEAKALSNAYICMVIALICVAIAIMVIVIKAFKWPVQCLLGTVVICLCACVCVCAALGLVHGSFKFKDDFNKAKRAFTYYSNPRQGSHGNSYYGDSSRNRRDDGSAGYSGHYTTPGPVTGYQPAEQEHPAGAGQMGQFSNTITMLVAAGQKDMINMIKHIELKESIGSPLTLAGLGIGLLLVVILLSIVEYFMLKKGSASEIKYQNVTLT